MYGFMRDYCKSIHKELPTDDLIHLFAEWLSLMDRWDKSHCHQKAEVVSDLKVTQSSDVSFATCVGEYVVKKGEKQIWKLKISGGDGLAGIVDDEIISDYERIGDFTNEQNEGYGINIHGGTRYGDAHPWVQSLGAFRYAQQFDFSMTYDSVVFEMELDMTQEENTDAILKFTYYHKTKGNINQIRTDGEYTNICFDKIDINKRYRLAVDIGGSSGNKSAEFLSE